MENNNAYKEWVAQELRDWAETFRDEADEPEDIEETNWDDHTVSTYEGLHDLADKYAVGECTKEELEEILFHLWQKNGQDE